MEARIGGDPRLGRRPREGLLSDKAGFTLDDDITVSDEIRFLRLTPLGSVCSIASGTGISDAPLGSARARIVVSDIQAARAELVERRVEASDVAEFPVGLVRLFNDPRRQPLGRAAAIAARGEEGRWISSSSWS